MRPPTIVTSFISLQPLEPVLVFNAADDAAYFQTHCRQGRILYDQNPRWVFLPMPEGLLRVRTARFGDVCYEFDSHRHASQFNESIKGLGRILQNTREKPVWDRSVYVGKSTK
ncbi:uncharacterized protein BDR25DRAFT_330892 [Lindgomyces ingoldianus]|uniref:Uncharacterized protein n=1 Tax=Lindgomyces ingoldianus TaxID=673940 RepID=A0ACB6RF46_9PLEO|nr:uncharacterized protein BDR25DRAFT_330892 [Lindgomyces ingoldianus]KAF2476945.1 hypothetical protein BDR25DRAFT_330892 [Lindgomyces ingoldianus]